ncbi:enoyl-CoA hydratase [Sphingoaurantiacus capsulatus]|uniref:Enoyl-CoA hydratase n=1 Tax=Sphingoaurantiacus capsulatus TaxID=1771310 RepID=A0ABV7XEQ5_9SPHN
MSDVVRVERDGGVMTLRINRPDKRNALTHAMYAGIADGLDAAAADPTVRVVVIAGAGGHFTAGNDLGDFLAGHSGEGERPVARFLRTISHFPKPLVAAVEGVAVGVGTTMLLHCDLVYAAEDAKLQLAFVNLALVPEAASSLLLPRVVGNARAAELFMFGEVFSGADAERYGIVNKAVPAGELEAFVASRAATLAAKPASALRATKKLLRHATTDTVPARMAEEGELFAAGLKSEETREAMTAFMEKRAPDFSRFA